MNNILFFITGITLGFYIKSKISSPSTKATPKEKSELDEMREEAHEALTERTEKRKEKILLALKNLEGNSMPDGSQNGQMCTPKPFTCSDVEKLLDVSDGTARKYLNELESENKIKQIGENGPNVYYILKT